ncbi:MAG: DNA cytosine methyltransferase [Symploca sp. SIO2D2]|nr:DNA cytosine methyltransferase [Symploca sp. SIO2D2]
MEAVVTSAHLFCGGGGDTQGALVAEYKPIWAIENNKYAAAVYRKRFPDVQLIESDIRQLSDEFIRHLSVPDVLIGGSPCPDFSIAGNRSGLEGSRGQLFFEFLRFLRLLQPKTFLFENVNGILSHDNGKTFQKIIEAFGQLGYMGSWQLRNGNRHVPQNRPRIFVVGIHREYTSNKVKPM